MGAYSKWAFIVMSTSNSCTAVVIMLFLAAATALSLNLKSYRSGVSTSVLVYLSLCHHKNIYSIPPCLQLVTRANSAPPTVPRPYMGEYYALVRMRKRGIR